MWRAANTQGGPILRGIGEGAINYAVAAGNDYRSLRRGIGRRGSQVSLTSPST